MLVLSLCYSRARWDKFEKCCVAACLGNSAVWLTLVTLHYFCLSECWLLLINGIGVLTLLRQVRSRPGTEDGWAWILYCLADVINLQGIDLSAGMDGAFPLLEACSSLSVVSLLLLARASTSAFVLLKTLCHDALTCSSGLKEQVKRTTSVQVCHFTQFEGHAALRYG